MRTPQEVPGKAINGFLESNSRLAAPTESKKEKKVKERKGLRKAGRGRS